MDASTSAKAEGADCAAESGSRRLSGGLNERQGRLRAHQSRPVRCAGGPERRSDVAQRRRVYPHPHAAWLGVPGLTPFAPTGCSSICRGAALPGCSPRRTALHRQVGARPPHARDVRERNSGAASTGLSADCEAALDVSAADGPRPACDDPSLRQSGARDRRADPALGSVDLKSDLVRRGVGHRRAARRPAAAAAAEGSGEEGSGAAAWAGSPEREPARRASASGRGNRSPPKKECARLCQVERRRRRQIGWEVCEMIEQVGEEKRHTICPSAGTSRSAARATGGSRGGGPRRALAASVPRPQRALLQRGMGGGHGSPAEDKIERSRETTEWLKGVVRLQNSAKEAHAPFLACAYAQRSAAGRRAAALQRTAPQLGIGACCAAR